MAYVLKCKYSIDGVYQGNVKLLVPNVDAPYVNFSYGADGDWNVVSSTMGDRGYDIFAYQNTGGFDPYSVIGISNPRFYLPTPNDATHYVEFELITPDSDRNKRVIKVNISAPYIIGGATSTIWGLGFHYMLNDVEQVYIPISYAYGISLGVYGGSYTNKHYYISCVPWIGIINGRKGLLSVNGEANVIYPDANPDHIYRTGLSWQGSVQYYEGSTEYTKFNTWLAGYNPGEVDNDNPYYDGGESDIGGGGGNFSEITDNPETDTMPSLSAVDTGFATIFKPSRIQLKRLSELFWNSNVFSFLQNLVENITDMFVSLAMVPFQVTAGSTVSVTWLGLDTAVTLTLAANQFYEFDMGTINLGDDDRAYTSGSALDYSPFSSLGIYLPFIGYRELDIDECRDATINLRYRIDILSGSCVAIIRVAGKDIYEFTGNCLTQIPITNENMQSLVSDAVNVGISVSAARAGVGAASAEMNSAGNTEIRSVGDLDKATKAHAHAEAHLAGARSNLASATANSMMGMKPSYEKSGNVSGANALMAVKRPYLFLKTPRQAIPAHYQRYCGFPSNITGKLSEFSGYTVVEDIRLNGLVATSVEIAEIYELLKKGVII